MAVGWCMPLWTTAAKSRYGSARWILAMPEGWPDIGGPSSLLVPGWPVVGFGVDREGKLKKTDVLNGQSAQSIADYSGFFLGGTWNREGTIVFASSGRSLRRVPANGGAVADASTVDTAVEQSAHLWPWFAPIRGRVSHLADGTWKVARGMWNTSQ